MCGIKINENETLGVDRVLDKPYTNDNIINVCFNCNNKKGSRTLKEFFSECII